ncbi:unnamed protein product [Clonostachys chloroleuca]|uniref:Uncharacterized protein n=1 Tax=Clonostachys chloroleuca TaxID=1926264 RepID=A0AA35Q086_9HYPO|nr:unnamed protein product [Clonostachys chloroleuca]
MAKHMEELALLLHFQYQIGQGEIAEGEGGNSVKAAMEAQNPTTVRRNPKTPAQAEQDRRTCQEPLREWSASKDAKVYGNFAAQGTLINIDGEDFVEYRVLMRPSFC